MRTAFLLALAATATISTSTTDAQSLRRLRSDFLTVLTAAAELRELNVQPGDANGSVRRWDREWDRRLQRLRTGSHMHRECMNLRPSCDEKERCALAPASLAAATSLSRSNVFREPDQWSLNLTWQTLAARRLVADEAARRRGQGLSCEDIPGPNSVLFDCVGCRVPETTEVLLPPATAEVVKQLWSVAQQDGNDFPRVMHLVARDGIDALQERARSAAVAGANEPPPTDGDAEAATTADGAD